jgi:hypothetical protein
MALTKIKSSGLQANVIYQALVAGTGVTLTANGSSQVIINNEAVGVKITTVAYSAGATAADIAGNQTITVTGSGFNANITAYVNTEICTTSYGNGTSLTFTTPAANAGTYNVILYNTDGTSGTKPGGIIFNSPPVWVTAAGALTAGINNTAYSNTVSATGTGITYGVTSGALPTGLSLNSSSGAITGTPTVANTFNFTITATNNYNQTTARAFSLVITSAVPTTALVVAGGGSGGTGYYGGGGGAGGLLESNVTLSLDVTYTITVGIGGVGTTTQTNRGGNGGNSTISGSGFTTITAIGGGGGGSRNNDTANGNATGANGGSGGGTAMPPTSVGGRGVYPGSAYLSQPRQGYDGAPAPTYGTDYGSGGGGAGAEGKCLSVNGTTDGGIGVQSSITGTSTYYGGGGGGAYGSGSAGTGGGGNRDTAGTANTGGGGGGATGNGGQGGTGGSGVVIIRYPNTYAAATTTGSPTITAITGYRIYKFTGTGTFTIPS